MRRRQLLRDFPQLTADEGFATQAAGVNP